MLGRRTVGGQSGGEGPESAWEWVEKGRSVGLVRWETDHPQAAAVREAFRVRWEDLGRSRILPIWSFLTIWWENTCEMGILHRRVVRAVETWRFWQVTAQWEKEQALRRESSDSDSGGDDSGDSCREDSDDGYVWVAHRRSRFRVAWETDHPQVAAIRALNGGSSALFSCDEDSLGFMWRWWMLQWGMGRVYDVVERWQNRATRRSRQLHARYQKKTHEERRPARRARWILGNMSVKWGIGIWARRVKKFKYRQGKTQEKKQEEKSLRNESSMRQPMENWSNRGQQHRVDKCDGGCQKGDEQERRKSESHEREILQWASFGTGFAPRGGATTRRLFGEDNHSTANEEEEYDDSRYWLLWCIILHRGDEKPKRAETIQQGASWEPELEVVRRHGVLAAKGGWVEYIIPQDFPT
jgi:hypothetical protein